MIIWHTMGRFRARFVHSCGHILEQVRTDGPRPDCDAFLLALIPSAVRIAQLDALAEETSTKEKEHGQRLRTKKNQSMFCLVPARRELVAIATLQLERHNLALGRHDEAGLLAVGRRAGSVRVVPASVDEQVGDGHGSRKHLDLLDHHRLRVGAHRLDHFAIVWNTPNKSIY